MYDEIYETIDNLLYESIVKNEDDDLNLKHKKLNEPIKMYVFIPNGSFLAGLKSKEIPLMTEIDLPWFTSRVKAKYPDVDLDLLNEHFENSFGEEKIVDKFCKLYNKSDINIPLLFEIDYSPERFYPIQVNKVMGSKEIPFEEVQSTMIPLNHWFEWMYQSYMLFKHELYQSFLTGTKTEEKRGLFSLFSNKKEIAIPNYIRDFVYERKSFGDYTEQMNHVQYLVLLYFGYYGDEFYLKYPKLKDSYFHLLEKYGNLNVFDENFGLVLEKTEDYLMNVPKMELDAKFTVLEDSLNKLLSDYEKGGLFND